MVAKYTRAAGPPGERTGTLGWIGIRGPPIRGLAWCSDRSGRAARASAARAERQ